MPEVSTMTITTTTVTEIKAGSAVSGGNIITDGGNPITSRGICWGTDPNPTINNIKDSDGPGLGSFTSDLAWLDPGTTYFVRAYAVNSTGVAYGNQLSFTTSFSLDPWTRKANFPGGLRYGSASFSIGTKAYFGIGFNDGDWPTRDFWEWDQTTNAWTRKADYPGKIEGNAVSFSIGTKGYIGTGDDFNTNGYTNEFWEYDPATNRWTQKASLPTTPGRGSAAGFSIGNKGYIGIGSAREPGWPVSFYHHDFWEWDQMTNVWTKKADYPGNSTIGAVGFSIGNKGYFGTGGDGTSYSKEFWEWDQATNFWTKKADFGGSARSSAIGFSIGNKGYIGTGVGVGGTLYNDFWEWDQAINNWKQTVNFGGMARTAALSFSIGNKGYVGTGGTGVDPNYALQDFWEYDPTN
jgi:N-acetylneuraminic acid mutarotase